MVENKVAKIESFASQSTECFGSSSFIGEDGWVNANYDTAKTIELVSDDNFPIHQADRSAKWAWWLNHE